MRKCSLIGLILAITSTIISPLTAEARERWSNCFELGQPSYTANSQVITLQSSMYAKCTENQLGNDLYSVVYRMDEEESLFNLQSCQGPKLATSEYRKSLGNVVCKLRIGTNSLPSPRTGAMSTTIVATFIADMSSISIKVPHSEILAASNNGWGGARKNPQIDVSVPDRLNIEASPVSLQVNSSNLDLALMIENSNEAVCRVTFDNPNLGIELLAEGECKFKLASAQTDKFEASPTREFSMEVYKTAVLPMASTKKTISCIKGKQVKKITAINPKCPAGFRKK